MHQATTKRLPADITCSLNVSCFFIKHDTNLVTVAAMPGLFLLINAENFTEKSFGSV